MVTNADDTYMREALGWARRGLGRTSPNPAVGAVVVRDGQVLGRGFHQRAGEAHAEVLALQEAAGLARGATLYVTLEPCPTTGRTGPCTEAILAAGVSRVVVASRDPDRHVDGRGLERLRRGGVEVTEGVLATEALLLNEAYVVHRRTGRPFVTLKWAMSLDGKIGARRDAPTWISGTAASAFAHELRNTHDAVLVGIGTVLADDPRLTCRVPGGRDPLRVIVDSRLRVPPAARVLNQSSPAPTLVVASADAPAERVSAVRAKGAEVLLVPGERPALAVLMDLLAARGLLSVLIEGGGTLHAAALAAGIVHKVIGVVSPSLIGGRGAPTAVEGAGPLVPEGLLRLTDVTVRPVGEDVAVEGYLPGVRALIAGERIAAATGRGTGDDVHRHR